MGTAGGFGWELTGGTVKGGTVFTLLQDVNTEIIISKNMNDSKRFFFKILFPFP